jgi:hypothetical protein
MNTDVVAGQRAEDRTHVVTRREMKTELMLRGRELKTELML